VALRVAIPLRVAILGGASGDLFLLEVDISPLQPPLLRRSEAGMYGYQERGDVLRESLA
jgi:hypothetical protein